MFIKIYRKFIKKKNKKIIFFLYLLIFFSIPIYLYLSENYKLFEMNNFLSMHSDLVFSLEEDLKIIMLIFFIFNIFWTFFIGLNTPLNIIAGFLFGNLNAE